MLAPPSDAEGAPAGLLAVVGAREVSLWTVGATMERQRSAACSHRHAVPQVCAATGPKAAHPALFVDGQRSLNAPGLSAGAQAVLAQWCPGVANGALVLAVAFSDGLVGLWRVSLLVGDERAEVAADSHALHIRGAKFSREASASDGVVRCDIEFLCRVLPPSGHCASDLVCAAHNGRITVAVGMSSGSVAVWSSLASELGKDRAALPAAVISPVVVAALDRRVIVRYAAAVPDADAALPGECVCRCDRAHDGPITGAVWGPSLPASSFPTLVTSDAYGTILRWNLEALCKPGCAEPCEVVAKADSGCVLGMSMCPGGSVLSYLASEHLDGYSTVPVQNTIKYVVASRTWQRSPHNLLLRPLGAGLFVHSRAQQMRPTGASCWSTPTLLPRSC